MFAKKTPAPFSASNCSCAAATLLPSDHAAGRPRGAAGSDGAIRYQDAVILHKRAFISQAGHPLSHWKNTACAAHEKQGRAFFPQGRGTLSHCITRLARARWGRSLSQTLNCPAGNQRRGTLMPPEACGRFSQKTLSVWVLESIRASREGTDRRLDSKGPQPSAPQNHRSALAFGPNPGSGTGWGPEMCPMRIFRREGGSGLRF